MRVAERVSPAGPSRTEVGAWYVGAAGLALGHTLVAQLAVLGCRVYEVAAQRRAGRVRLAPAASDVPLLALAGWMLFSGAFALKPGNAVGSTIAAVLTGWLTVSCLRRSIALAPATAERLPRVFVWAAGCGSGYAIVVFLVRLVRGEAVARGELPFVGSNAAGTVFALATMVSLGLLGRLLGMPTGGGDRRRERTALTALVAILLVGVIVTGCRGALVAVLVGLVVMGLGRDQRRIVVGSALSLAVVITSAALFYPPLLTRVASTTSLASNEDRIEIWRTALLILRDHPVVGVGVNNFRAAYVSYPHPPQFHEQHSFAHNIFLEFGAVTGVPGLLLVGWVVWTAMRNGIRGRSRQFAGVPGPAVLACFVALLVHLQFDMTIYSVDMLPLFFGSYAALASMGEPERESLCARQGGLPAGV